MTAQAAGEEDSLIEDSGELEVVQEGENLEDVRAAESEAAAQAAAEAEARAEEEAQKLLEDSEVQLEPASADQLSEYLANLTSVESPTGSDGELLVAGYIESIMESYGYTISEHSFHEGFLNASGVDAPGINIIAERGADSENRTNDILIVSTHYDSKTAIAENNGILGMGKTEAEAAAEAENGSAAEGTTESKTAADELAQGAAQAGSAEEKEAGSASTGPDPFANDKSGVAALLELARILSYEETDTDICFLFFSGEEDGLYGSANFIKSMEEEFAGRLIGNLHVQLVGYTPDMPYMLGTADGAETYLGNLVRTEAVRMRGILNAGEVGESQEQGENQDQNENQNGNQAPAESGADQEWNYFQEENTAQKSFADAGIPAVTVMQKINWGNAEAAEGQSENAGETPAVDIEKLQDITDVLAASIYKVMSEETGEM